MTQLFIPEIGTELKLAEDWTFELHAEYRNQKMFERTPYHANSISVGARYAEKEYILTKEQYKVWEDHVEELYNQCTEMMKSKVKTKFGGWDQETDKFYWEERAKFEEAHRAEYQEHVFMTIPKDAVLKVDRIYIRKGKGDYSSITFYTQFPGEKKKVRFWAKLEDCNKIKFE